MQCYMLIELMLYSRSWQCRAGDNLISVYWILALYKHDRTTSKSPRLALLHKQETSCRHESLQRH